MEEGKGQSKLQKAGKTSSSSYDDKLQEMKGVKVKIYGRNGECNYYVCCIDLRGLYCSQIEMAFMRLGLSLTKTLSSLLTRPCCYGNVRLDTGAQARFDNTGLMDVFLQHSQLLSSYFLLSRRPFLLFVAT